MLTTAMSGARILRLTKPCPKQCPKLDPSGSIFGTLNSRPLKTAHLLTRRRWKDTEVSITHHSEATIHQDNHASLFSLTGRETEARVTQDHRATEQLSQTLNAGSQSPSPTGLGFSGHQGLPKLCDHLEDAPSNSDFRTEKMAKWVECLLHKHEHPCKMPGVVAWACNPRAGEVKMSRPLGLT